MDSGNNKKVSETKTNLAFIKKTELFAGLSIDEIDFVVSHLGTLKLSSGALLFSEGEEAKHFYILTGGAIRVFKARSDGGEDEMARFKTGDTIGDFDFARGAQYDACAEAAEDSELIEFPGFGLTMDDLAREDSHTVCSILLNAIVMMTERIKSTRRLTLKNIAWVQELHRRAYEDPGTGLWKQALITDEIKSVLNNPSALIMLKPDRFKTLVDSRGHSTGDEAMIRIALILKDTVSSNGQGWPLRFKSNETGIIFNNCDSCTAEKIAGELLSAIAALEPVPAQDGLAAFHFSATISWAIWPVDGDDWDELFKGNYACLLDTWRSGGEKIVHYRAVKP